MSMIYVIKDAFRGEYLVDVHPEDETLDVWRRGKADARKFSTVGDLTAFAEAHEIDHYEVEKIAPAEVEAMAAAMHAAGEAARLKQEGATA